MTPQPPRLALALLTRYRPGDDGLVGDLLEQFADRPSRLWFWRETIVALAAMAFRRPREIRPLVLVDDRDRHGPIGPRVSPARTPSPIDLSVTHVGSIGGLGLLAMVLLVTLVVPQFWWLVAGAAGAGVLLGVGRILLRWRG